MKENWLKDELNRRLSRKESISDFSALWDELESKRYPQKKSRKIWIWPLSLLLISFSGIYLMLMQNADLSISTSTIIDPHNEEMTPLPILDRVEQRKQSQPITHITKNTDEILKSEDHLLRPLAKFTIDYPPKNNSVQTQTCRSAEAKNTLYPKGNTKQSGDRSKSLPFKQKQVSKDKNSIVARSLIFAQEKLPLRPLTPILSFNSIKIQKPDIPNWYRNLGVINKKRHLLSLSSAYGAMASDLNRDNMGSTGKFSQAYIDERNNIETNEDHFDFSLQYTYQFSDHFNFQTGLTYQQYTSKYSLTTIDRYTEIVMDTVAIYMQGTEIIDVLIDDVPVSITSSERTTNFIKYRLLRIPVLLGYQLVLNNQFSLTLSTGFSIGFHSIGDSRFLNPDFTSSHFLNEEDAGYSQGIQLENLTQLTVNRNFSNGWMTFVGLRNNRDISNRMRSEVQAKHKLRSMNFVLGVGKRF